MIKNLINGLLLTIMTATPGVVGVSGAYYPETENTSVLNERLGWYDYGLATVDSEDFNQPTIDGVPHYQLKGNYFIDPSKLNDFLPTLQSWYLPEGEITDKLDTTTNNTTSFFQVEMYNGQGDTIYYFDRYTFTSFDLAMIKEGMPVQLKDWNSNNYEPSETRPLRITIQLKMTEAVFTHNITSIIGNKDFYVWLLTKIAGNNAYYEGYTDGYKDGRDKGREEGYIIGLDAGGGDGTVNNVFVLLEKGWNGMTNMLEIEVFPNLTIGGLLMIPLLFTIGLFIFKVLT